MKLSVATQTTSKSIDKMPRYFFRYIENSTMHCALVCIIYFSLFPARLLLLNLNLGAASKDSSECCRDGQTKVHNNNSKRNVNILSQFISYVTNSLLQGNLLRAIDNKTICSHLGNNLKRSFALFWFLARVSKSF